MIKIYLATNKDKKLFDYFKHYKIKEIIKKRINCYLEHNFTVVAKDENKIVGVLQWYIKENPNNGVVEFEEVFVSKDYRNKGIGSSLVKFAIKSVKKYFKKLKIKPRKIFLFVGKKNKAAQVLYKKQGFKFISKVNDLFHDKETELFYSLNL
jgi:ribosomal protein S18 acetylase RimI-like enzyme